MQFYAILILFLINTSIVYTFRTLEARAIKGKFFIHTLHSASFFNSTVGVKWSATSKNRPVLPHWLKLVESKYSALAYLTGTPITTQKQVLIHVIATRLDTFESEQQQLVISLNEDERFTGVTQEILQLTVSEKDPESILRDRTGMIENLERAISTAFSADQAYPYIFEIAPEFVVPGIKLLQSEHKGVVISIGTQSRFTTRLHNFVSSLQNRGAACKKNHMIPVNRHFASLRFSIDWCKTKTKKYTNLPSATYQPSLENTIRPIYLEGYKEEAPQDPPHQVRSLNNRFSFLEGILLFPVIAVVCIFLVLVLSIIFFGKREGQQWRDYKTSKTQLEEYANVRDTQRHLRELSLQRQLLIMSKDNDQSVCGIRAFIQPKQRSTMREKTTSESALSPQGRRDRSIEATPVGKQTVADAAKQCGGSLHFYKNPFESESDEKSDEDTALSGPNSTYH